MDCHGYGWTVGWRGWQLVVVVVEVTMVVEEQGLSYKGEDKCKEIRKTRRISEKEEELYQTFASGVHGRKFWMRNFYFRENEVGCS